MNCCVIVVSHSSKVGNLSPQVEHRVSCGWGRGGHPWLCSAPCSEGWDQVSPSVVAPVGTGGSEEGLEKQGEAECEGFWVFSPSCPI